MVQSAMDADCERLAIDLTAVMVGFNIHRVHGRKFAAKWVTELVAAGEDVRTILNWTAVASARRRAKIARRRKPC